MTGMTAAPPPTASTPDGRRPGLRERKKTKTREAIRAATYTLIEEQGWEATTIDRIAARAEVSPSTVLRYFPAKEDIVVTDASDAYDALLLAEIRRRPPAEPWPDTVRHVLRQAVLRGAEEDARTCRLRTRLMVQVPAVRSRMRESMAGTGRMLCRAIGERTGRDPDGLEVRVHAMALVGGLMETSLYWAEKGHRDDLASLADRALDVLAHGLTGENG
ncbi:TetR family transcriptional regulator [Streptomyces dangxiongensis]|uniref:TetR family transcriptional regulator n=1 Tax=Streptomyces dangxiongensis TaxID=1442032 RepID=A0A3G2JBJ4_9ACTN|nr:TetR family transcriptional regulator [Streptomyces dangxiongensis]AYN39703.1 TetR family transcriptional regulator [Streptomyces dangxiongensis]